MADAATASKQRPTREHIATRLRLVSGWTLFAFIACHLLNHALGLISVAAMEDGLFYLQVVWLHPPGAFVLNFAFLLHFFLALRAVYRRRHLFRMPVSEAIQLVFGLSIIPLLAAHFVGTYIAFRDFGANVNYAYVLLYLWVAAPMAGVQQAAILVVAWVHGCIGIWFWLRLKPWYRAAQPVLFALALLVPTMGLVGFAAGGKEIAALAADPAWLEQTLAALKAPDESTRSQMGRVETGILLAFAVTLLATLVARAMKFHIERRQGRVRLTYPGGRVVEIAPGMTVLDASLINGIPHAHVCGGHGRCSTCRIRVSRGLDELPLPSSAERSVLARVAAEPAVRLACQVRPTRDLTLAPLVPATAGAAAGWGRASHLRGQEQEVAILFADLRGFTELSERKLPYDVVFVLNRYFAAMGQAVERAGGQVDKFIGDGVMALFGVGEAPVTGARNALKAARGMAASLAELNETLTHDLDRPLRLGIGIHAGPAIVGEMGYARAVSVTAIGDTVNTASRIEAMTKDFNAQLVVSESVVRYSGFDLSAFPLRETVVRGRAERLPVRVVERASDLPV